MKMMAKDMSVENDTKMMMNAENGTRKMMSVMNVKNAVNTGIKTGSM
jgi:hypothetical protein